MGTSPTGFALTSKLLGQTLKAATNFLCLCLAKPCDLFGQLQSQNMLEKKDAFFCLQQHRQK